MAVVQHIFDRGEDAHRHIALHVFSMQRREDRDVPPISIGPDAGFDNFELDAVSDGIELFLDQSDDGPFCEFFRLGHFCSHDRSARMVAKSRQLSRAAARVSLIRGR